MEKHNPKQKPKPTHADKKQVKPKPTNRTYTLPHHANKKKIEHIVQVLPEFQKTIRTTQAWQYQRLLEGEDLWNRADPKHIPSKLSERYKRSVLNQTVGGLSSWQTQIQDEFRKIVTRSSLPPEQKRDLYRINASKAWFYKTLTLEEIGVDEEGIEYKTGIFYQVSPLLLKQARRIFKHVRKHKQPLPKLDKTRTMLLDGPVAQFEESRTNSFSHWVRISTLTKNKPVWIPLQSYEYADQAGGVWAALTQVTVSPDGSIVIKQVKKRDHVPLLDKIVDDQDPRILGLDYGLHTLFASTMGDLVGRSLYPWLLKVDEQLTTLAKSLQQQGIRLSSNKRYKRFQQRIREHVKNETNRCLNRLVELHDPSEIVVERLDFRYGGLSKRLNRIVSRIGRSVVKTKLKSLEQTRGIRVTLVPAAYSSQECYGCGFVSKTNRKHQLFECGFCGRKCHADYNAAHVIRSRRSWSSVSQWLGRTLVLDLLDLWFEQQWGISPKIVRTKCRVGPTIKNASCS